MAYTAVQQTKSSIIDQMNFCDEEYGYVEVTPQGLITSDYGLVPLGTGGYKRKDVPKSILAISVPADVMEAARKSDVGRAAYIEQWLATQQQQPLETGGVSDMAVDLSQVLSGLGTAAAGAIGLQTTGLNLTGQRRTMLSAGRKYRVYRDNVTGKVYAVSNFARRRYAPRRRDTEIDKMMKYALIANLTRRE